MDLTYENLCSLVQLRITDVQLYRRALTHKSCGDIGCNERLEFIGDAVLNLAVSEYLYETYPDEDEGFLTKARIRIVNGKTLARIGQAMELSKYVRMNDKAMRSGWNTNPRILEDLVESLVGAVYLDLGFFASKQFVRTHILDHLSESDILDETNYKDCLIRYARQDAHELDYQLVTDTGSGSSRFHVRLVFQGKELATGYGATKKDAEQHAAQQAVVCLGIDERREKTT